MHNSHNCKCPNDGSTHRLCYERCQEKKQQLTLLVLDLALHVVDGVRGLHLQGDGLACQCLHKDLHATTQAEYKVEGGLLLDVVVGQGTAILQLLAGKDKALLVWGDTCIQGQHSKCRTRCDNAGE